MQDQDDPIHNPPAFPFSAEQAQRGWNGTRAGEPGMSLRDYFAASALQSLLNPKIIVALGDENPGVEALNPVIAGHAYAIADAMLKVRKP